MTNATRTSSYLMGNQSLLIQCAEDMLTRGHEVRGVISDNGDIARWALGRGLRVVEPGEGLEHRLGEEPFDWLLSIANPPGVPRGILGRPRKGTVHFHDALLADYAGFHCTTWAILHGRRVHGVTWCLLAPEDGQGRVLAERRFDVSPSETALTLNTRCYEAGMESFSEVLAQLEHGEPRGEVRDLRHQTRFGPHDRPSPGGILRWEEPAARLAALVRSLDFGSYPNPLVAPKVWTAGRVVHVLEAEALPTIPGDAPGTVLEVGDRGIDVATGEGILRLSRLRSPSGRELGPREAAAELGVSAGGRLEGPDAAAMQALAELEARAACDEAHWIERIGSCSPVELPMVDAQATPGEGRVLPLRLPEGFDGPRTVALYTAWVARMVGQPGAWLGLGVEPPSGVPAGLFLPTVPWWIGVPGDARLDELASRGAGRSAEEAARAPLASDVFARVPGLRAPRLDAAVRFDEAPSKGGHPLAPVTLQVAPGEPPSLAFDGGRVAQGDAEAVRSQLEAMAAAVTTDPTCPVARLPLMSEAERRRVLVQWNATTRDVPEPRLIHRLVHEQALRTPDATALISGGEALTYAELDTRANRLARHLQRLGVGPDELVGLCLPRTADLVVAVLAIHRAGGAYVPLDPAYPAERLAFMLADSGASVVVTRSEHLHRLGDATVTAVRMDADGDAIASLDPAPVSSDVTPRNLAYVIYTSGSTGTPKGVMVEHGQVANFFLGMDEVVPRKGDGTDTWLAVTSLSFDISVLELLWTLARGFRVVLAPDGDRVRASGGAAEAKRSVGFSLFYFASDEGADGADKYELLLEGARFADRHGFEAVWTPERHFHAFGGLYPNPAVASAALAVITDRVKIRAGSCVLPLHHPVRVVEEWSLVDNLSKGRVGVSFAAGWQPNDFVLRPESFADPKGAMLRDLDVVRRLWRGETLELDGPKGGVPVRTLPRPVQPELPVWLTAAGNPATFEAAGRAGAGLLTHLLGQSMDELESKVAAYRRAWREAGHPGVGHVTLMLHTFVGPDADEVKERVRGPMKQYLGSSLGLIKQHAWAFPAFKRHAQDGASFEDNFQSLSPEDTDALLEHSFERYYGTSGLFGTPEGVLGMVERAQGVGVDEIACLIDFGIDSRTVLAHLPYLEQVRARAAATEEGARRGPDESLATLLERHGVTHLQCTPSLARMLVADDGARHALRGLRHLFVGGEALPGALAEELAVATDATITNMYGPTETTIWSSVHRTGPCAGTVPIGRPLPNTKLYVLDGQGEPVPVGVPGELHIGGEGVTRGYLGREALTRDRFVPDPFVGGEARMYRTGDRVRQGGDGVVEFLGRIDHQVKVRGHRIELGEIEARLGEHAGVAQAVVTAREDVPGDLRLVAYVVPAPETAMDGAALRTYLREQLPEPMVPAHFVALEGLPLTPNGKVDRKALPAPSAGQRVEVEAYVPPRGDTQEKLAAIWCRILGLGQVGSKDNFFDLGGHSLLAVQAHREIREALGRDLTVTDIFRFPTIGALAEHLEGGEQGFEQDAERGAARRAAMLRRRSARRPRAGGGQ
jgi:natural product biosynthesis luciferase-like monooxygenase protein